MNEKLWDVFIYGDVNIDLVVPGVEVLPAPGTEENVKEMPTFVGGGAALFTLGIAKLGLKPVLQGALGDDMYGHYIRDVFKKTGADDSLIATSKDKNTGISISFTTEKDRCFLTYVGTNEGISLKKMDLDKVKYAKHVHVTGYEGPKNHAEYYEVLKKIHNMGTVSVSFDVGWDMSGAWSEEIFELLPMIDVLFMNETECAHYTRCDDIEKGARMLADKAKMAVIKLGAKGSLAIKDGVLYEAPAFKVKAVDTTGAGDSFNAGFISSYLMELPILECLRRANACGALSVTALGGNTAFPYKEELDKFLLEHA